MTRRRRVGEEDVPQLELAKNRRQPLPALIKRVDLGGALNDLEQLRRRRAAIGEQRCWRSELLNTDVGLWGSARLRACGFKFILLTCPNPIAPFMIAKMVMRMAAGELRHPKSATGGIQAQDTSHPEPFPPKVRS